MVRSTNIQHAMIFMIPCSNPLILSNTTTLGSSTQYKCTASTTLKAFLLPPDFLLFSGHFWTGHDVHFAQIWTIDSLEVDVLRYVTEIVLQLLKIYPPGNLNDV